MLKKGFTLIELLVSIAIMVVILSLTFAGLNSARARSRDAKRIADLRTLQAALEQHSLGDPSRAYPPDKSADDNDPAVANYCAKYKTNTTIKGIYDNPCFKDYLSVIPIDPRGVEYSYNRPACFTDLGNGKTEMTQKATAADCTGIFSRSYGLHVDLETNSPEGINDFTPQQPKSFDLAP